MSIIVFPVILILLLYVWQAYLADKNVRQSALRIASHAGAYGLVLFTTIGRKLWGIAYGFLVVSMELTDNRSEFFVQQTGRRRFWGGKLISAGIVSLAIVFLVCLLPYLISVAANRNSFGRSSAAMLFLQCWVVWLMTYGSVLTGMLSALFVREIMGILAVVVTLEFFSGLYPQALLNLWDRLDGYVYISSLMLPLKKELEGLSYFSFQTSTLFSAREGLLLWILLMAGYMGSGCIIFDRKNF